MRTALALLLAVAAPAFAGQEVDPIDRTIFRGLIFAPEAAPIARDFT
jgi:hypothetical protein